ncbi:MAG: MBOAT family O-acyltransferase [Candidatus Melainabacteria bacterium]|nr:MBOAT family O-acyltransferase [Candidatus Melainabacteria bacterium]
MLFTSLQYLLFLPACVLLYWILPRQLRLGMLLIASWYFYMSWMPVFILLIVFMTAFNYFWGAYLNRSVDNRKTIFTIGIVANLLCLGVFKYANFAVNSASSVAGLIGGHDPGWTVNIVLPLAISFFTFEFIHYLFEIYRGNKPIQSFVLFALFASFFPTQIAGPIKRYPDFVAQMKEHENKRFSLSMLDEGVPLIVLGFAKKLLLADNLAVVVNMMAKQPLAYGAPELWLFAYAFAFQIYFDFCGYTDIARGSAMLMGYKIPLNFNMPYIANNMSNFWHRWHISLSTWLRDYLFIPLGGSRNGAWQTNRNLFLTMALGGLWHGASWNFAVWGVFHGLALIVHRQFGLLKEKFDWLSSFCKTKWWNLASILITFHVVCIGWVFFVVPDMGTAFGVVKRMILLRPMFTFAEQSGQFLVLRQELPITVMVAILLCGILLVANFPVSILKEKNVFGRAPSFLKAAYCCILILLMVTFQPDKSEPFIYFQF